MDLLRFGTDGRLVQRVELERLLSALDPAPPSAALASAILN